MKKQNSEVRIQKSEFRIAARRAEGRIQNSESLRAGLGQLATDRTPLEALVARAAFTF